MPAQRSLNFDQGGPPGDVFLDAVAHNAGRLQLAVSGAVAVRDRDPQRLQVAVEGHRGRRLLGGHPLVHRRRVAARPRRGSEWFRRSDRIRSDRNVFRNAAEHRGPDRTSPRARSAAAHRTGRRGCAGCAAAPSGVPRLRRPPFAPAPGRAGSAGGDYCATAMVVRIWFGFCGLLLGMSRCRITTGTALPGAVRSGIRTSICHSPTADGASPE